MKYISSTVAIYRLTRDKLIQYTYDYWNGHKMDVSRVDKKNNGGVIAFINNITRDPDHIIDNIYIGNGYNACNYETLKKYNFKNILNVTKEFDNYFEDINYKKIKIMDWKTASMKPYFEEIIKFLNEKSKEKGNILVHCYMGSSRSATAVILYLITNHKISLNDAIDYAKSKRNIINLNKKFKKELQEYILQKKLNF